MLSSTYVNVSLSPAGESGVGNHGPVPVSLDPCRVHHDVLWGAVTGSRVTASRLNQAKEKEQFSVHIVPMQRFYGNWKDGNLQGK